MFGAEFIELIAFGKQVGMVLVGSAALWGFVFLRINRRVAQKLLIPLFGGGGLAILFWMLLSGMLPAYAHEGIVLEPARADIMRALELFSPLFFLWACVTIAGALAYIFKKEYFFRHIAWFFGIQFCLAALLVSFSVWVGEWNKEQLFFIGHNLHSIFTFGTVLILDFLYVVSKNSHALKKIVYPKFPAISKVIWIGLGIDFLSVALVFREALDLTPKFFFMQTVIGILIINGVLLAGPITRRMLASLRERTAVMEKKWVIAADIAGTVSISSWFSVTFVDFFEHLTFAYWQFLLLYGGLICTLFFAHAAWEKVESSMKKLDVKKA
jgi:hypothetical protein